MKTASPLLALLLALWLTGCRSTHNTVDPGLINAKFSNSLGMPACRTELGSSYTTCTFQRTPDFDAFMRQSGPRALGTRPRQVMTLQEFRRAKPLSLSNKLAYGCKPEEIADHSRDRIAVYNRVLFLSDDEPGSEKNVLLDFEGAIGPLKGCVTVIGDLQ
ncbi:hypothetical protein [Deinococcus ficus]|uniref:hypothetical protein n=1 Tax=Deinococcus ficus TaxID=317577 RepID=UPI001F31EB5C|nr:hypothetical protein [Deinococcus ficus]